MHVVIQPHGMISVGVVSFRSENQVLSEFRIAIEGPNAFDNVSKVDIEGFLLNSHHSTFEFRQCVRQLIHKLVQPACVLVRKA